MYLRIAVLPFALLCLATSCSAYRCEQIPGALVQIDVGVGQVFGVNRYDNIFTLYGQSWVQVPGALKHVTVGPAGIWGVNKNNNIFKLVAGDWVIVPGLLKQIDAGGDMFVAGANHGNEPFCLQKGYTTAYKGVGDAIWVHISGLLKYYSCGPCSCWGVNHNDQIYIRKGVSSNACMGAGEWQHIPGSLSMIEVGNDGSVYGVNSQGVIYRRVGTSCNLPEGDHWSPVQVFSGQVKHVSYDLGYLWVILENEHIHKCAAE